MKEEKTLKDLGMYDGPFYDIPEAMHVAVDKALRRSGEVSIPDQAWLWALARITWDSPPKDELCKYLEMDKL